MKFINICLLSLGLTSLAGLTACNSGGGSTAMGQTAPYMQLSTPPGGKPCTNMSTADTCSILVNYNFSGESLTSSIQLTAYSAPSAVLNDTYIKSMQNCEQIMNSSISGTCTIVLSYVNLFGESAVNSGFGLEAEPEVSGTSTPPWSVLSNIVPITGS